MSNFKEEVREVTPDGFEEMLLPRVAIEGASEEKNIDKVDALVFELYKETASVVNLAAHFVDEAAAVKGGWPRNQAICAGLMIRISKFMRVVLQLSAKGDRAEVIKALNRSILESAVNLEFLVRTNDNRFFDQFVIFSLGPERELYDLIQANVDARGGEVLPIERRMLDSIDHTCQSSGVRIDDIKRKYGDWGGGIRERLRTLGKEEQYVLMQRLPSHAVHGTWVDLCIDHLVHDARNDTFAPDNRFSPVDSRVLAPVAVFVLGATRPYIERFFPRIQESEIVLNRIDDLTRRICEVDAVHEKLMCNELWPEAPRG